MPGADATGDEDGERDQAEHDRRVEVGLAQDEHADHGEHDQHGSQDAAPIVEILHPAGEEVGCVHEERQLRDLGRLEPEQAAAEPASRPGNLDADAGDQHDEKEDQAHDEERSHALAPCVVVDARRDHERGRRHRDPCHLALEEVPGRAVVGERRDRRRRQHHDGSDDVEDPDRRHEQQVVGRAGRARAHPPPPEGAQGRRSCGGGHATPCSLSRATSRAKSLPRAE